MPSRLQQEIKQTRPFRSAGQEASIGLLRTADELRRYFSTILEPSGITTQQYNVLRILRGAGPEGLPTLEIAARMIELSMDCMLSGDCSISVSKTRTHTPVSIGTESCPPIGVEL